MIHLDSVVFYSLAAFICFTLAAIFQSFNEIKKEESYMPSELYTGKYDDLGLKPGQIAIPGHWKESAKELIQIVKKMQEPRTIAVINDKAKTRKTKRIRKGSNKRTQKKNSPARTRNKTTTKRNRL